MKGSRKIKEHDRVVLIVARRAARLAAGDVGTVVHVYADKNAFEVEFLTLTGRTAAVVTLETTEVRPVDPRDMVHARALKSA